MITFSRMRTFAHVHAALIFLGLQCLAPTRLAAAAATPADSLKVPAGFKVELLRSSRTNEGSWISMAVDPKGRLIISPQDASQPLLRFTIKPGGAVEKIEPLDVPIHTAMGLLYAFDSLYVSGAGPDGVAIYRLFDRDNDDRFQSVTLFKKFPGGAGEHGAHAIVLGPDEKLYIINGNSTSLPDGVDAQSPFQNYREDDLLPRVKDPVATFFDTLKIPYGYLLRTDREGNRWELLAGGMRNVYDIDFNPDGELFGYDSDMEWEWGTGWYRPTRVIHLVSGAEFGFREGSAKWPSYYADSTPAMVDIGIGSPTGVKYGSKAHFPARYRDVLYIADWSYGRILAVHLKEHGSTYEATFEPFVAGKPLNVSDIEIGADGAMYFITGGRGTQSGLYRVSYTKEIAPAPSPRAASSDAAATRKIRHELEAFHGKPNDKAVAAAWPRLGSPDRFVRSAARVAIESQPVEQWQERALAETDPDRALAALLALARVGGTSVQGDLFNALDKFKAGDLNERQQLEALRIIALSFARQGKPDGDLERDVIDALDPLFPAHSAALNFELCQILVYLNAPQVVEKTLTLMERSATQEEQTKYALYLRLVRSGWTLDQRRRYFSWFKSTHMGSMGQGTYPGGAGYFVWTNATAALSRHPKEVVQWFTDVGWEYGDGASFQKFMEKIRDEAVETLTADERLALAPLLRPEPVLVKIAPQREHQFVREWAVKDLEREVAGPLRGRKFENGKEALAAAQCLACHRIGNEGGSVGPDLTTISSRFTPRDILESIIEPSKVISEQFQSTRFVLKDGDDVSGLIVEETPDKFVVLVNPLENGKMDVPRANIASRTASKLSPMPEGLANILSRDEILDLLAYLMAGGKSNHAVFRK